MGGGEPPELDAEQLGGALATALLTTDIADGLRRGPAAGAGHDRGLRLTLSLAARPRC